MAPHVTALAPAVAGSVSLLVTTTHNPVWWIGVLLDAVATLAGTVGKQLLRYAVITGNPWYYPLGLVATAIIDPAFDLTAYNFAAQSIIAPCAGMVVVWNVLLAPFTLKERVTKSRLVAACFICVGTVLTGLFGSHSDYAGSVADYLALFGRPAALIYYAIFLLWSLVCCYYFYFGSAWASGFSMAALGGSLAGNMFTTKAAVEMVRCLIPGFQKHPSCEPHPFLTSVPYLFMLSSLVLSCAALWMLAIGLRSFEALYMITVYEGFMIITGAISGNIILNEKASQSYLQLWGYTCSISVILFGLVILCRGEPNIKGTAGERTGLSRSASDPGGVGGKGSGGSSSSSSSSSKGGYSRV